jgi:ATP-dependent DNA ligase
LASDLNTARVHRESVCHLPEKREPHDNTPAPAPFAYACSEERLRDFSVVRYLSRPSPGNDLVYAGKVDHGFDKTSVAELRKRLTPLIRKTQPYAKRIAHKGIWVEPGLLAEIEYRAKSAAGKVRHPFFRGLREDL